MEHLKSSCEDGVNTQTGVRICLFGPPTFSGLEINLPTFKSERRARTLLMYFAVRRNETITVDDTIRDMYWNLEGDKDQYLSEALTALRSALPDGTARLPERPTNRIDPSSPEEIKLDLRGVYLDLEVFDTAITDAGKSEDKPAEKRKHLKRAVGVYRDRLAQGVPEWIEQDWIITARKALHQRWILCKRELAKLADAEDDVEEAEGHLEDLINDSPTNTQHYVQRMSIFASRGNVLRINDVYQQFARNNPKKDDLDAAYEDALQRAEAVKRSALPLSQGKTAHTLSDPARSATHDSVINRNRNYVPIVSDQELNTLSTEAFSQHFVELTGAPGLGKSEVARKVIHRIMDRRPGLGCIELTVPPCNSTRHLCAVLSEYLDGGNSPIVAEDRFVRRAVREPAVVWIREYDMASVPALVSFLHSARLVAENDPSGSQAIWIVESHVALEGFESVRFAVPHMSHAQVFTALQAFRPGGGYPDIEEVIRKANGNPGDAIALWQRRAKSDQAPARYPYSWFLLGLTNVERQVLHILCVAQRMSPLGLTTPNVTTAAASVIEYPKGTIRSALESLGNKLTEAHLMSVVKLGRRLFDGLLDDVLPDAETLDIFLDMKIGLAEHVSSEISPDRATHIRSAIRDALSQHMRPDSLERVTLSLLDGDPEAFYASTFRYSGIRRTNSWMETTSWVSANSSAAYVTKALRLVTRLFTTLSDDEPHLSDVPADRPISAEDEIGLPPTHNAVTAQLSTCVQALCDISTNRHSVDALRAIQAEWVSCQDDVTKTEVLLRISSMLCEAGHPAQALEMLRSLLSQRELAPWLRAVVVFRTLSFLNRTHEARDVIGDAEAVSLIKDLSAELIAYAMPVSNFQLVCDAIFFYSRSVEYRLGRQNVQPNPEQLASYSTAFTFLEGTSISRSRHLQILLTQGSVFRHQCLRGELAWDDFRTAMNDAISYYFRALRSAIALGNKKHQYNAVSYLGQLCKLSLRHGDIAESNDYIVASAQLVYAEALSMSYDEVEPQYDHIGRNIRRAQAVLLAVILLAETRSLEAADRQRLNQRLMSLQADIASASRNLNDSKNRTFVNDTLKHLDRLMRFATCHHPDRFQHLLPSLQRLVREFEQIFSRARSQPKDVHALFVKLRESAVGSPGRSPATSL